MTLKIKRATDAATTPTTQLQYGELGIYNNHLNFGNFSNTNCTVLDSGHCGSDSVIELNAQNKLAVKVGTGLTTINNQIVPTYNSYSNTNWNNRWAADIGVNATHYFTVTQFRSLAILYGIVRYTTATNSTVRSVFDANEHAYCKGMVVTPLVSDDFSSTTHKNVYATVNIRSGYAIVLTWGSSSTNLCSGFSYCTFIDTNKSEI